MQSEHRKFPVFDSSRKLPQFVKLDLLNEEQALINHNQCLLVLAERGGLSWTEVYWNYYKLPINTHQNESQMLRMMEALAC